MTDPVIILAGACSLLIIGMFCGCLLTCMVQQRYQRAEDDYWSEFTGRGV
ncbi:hypothetical protein [Shinella zoogloeoides]